MATSTGAAERLQRYLEALDGPEPLAILLMLAPGFRFSILWTADGESREFAGGVDELRGYLAQRDADGQIHHVLASSRAGDSEVVFGRTTRYGEPLGTYMLSAQLDDDGLISHLFAARTTSVAFGDLHNE